MINSYQEHYLNFAKYLASIEAYDLEIHFKDAMRYKVNLTGNQTLNDRVLKKYEQYFKEVQQLLMNGYLIEG